MCLVLAFLVFQKEPLRRDELIRLLSPFTTESSISSAIDNLMPVIAEAHPVDGEMIRCSHKSFSDVLEKPDALKSSFHHDADETWRENGKKKVDTFRDELLPELTESAQCLRLARACLHALNTELKFQVSALYDQNRPITKESVAVPPFLCHASKYWQKYCELAGERGRDIKPLPHRHAICWMEALGFAEESGLESGFPNEIQKYFEKCQTALWTVSARGDARNPGPSNKWEGEHEELEQLLAPNFQSLPRGCQPGIRVSILDRIKKWVKDSVPANPNIEFVGESANSPFAGAGACPRDSPTSYSNILWISGDDGMGKTAIASSVVTLLNSTEFGDVIHAHYFISDDVKKGDPRRIWCTIAYQLAISSPAYRRILSESGVLTTDTKDLNVKDLFEALIKTPLSQLNMSIVVVIDEEFASVMQAYSHESKRRRHCERARRGLPYRPGEQRRVKGNNG
ncbi:hypothetical protein SCHPADRAFT_516305 [Schizopora paradoxa]|uniref:Nephrocystin 3-like N-terminal domain-containing protein n=1 Tax=Schizopora paradoxa TaxID=27342 RepID=A0A0H2S0E7_9AGAM|nr:hypothetical protein SCHPADRAFT_516305 [Schizopora paradoxa]